jgi:oligopeptidase B
MKSLSLSLTLVTILAMNNPTAAENTRSAEPAAPPAPPVARKAPKVTVLHGDRLVDDYFWLRDRANPEVAAYLEAENAYADALMKPTAAFQEALYKEMLGRIKETDLSVPYYKAGYWYYSRTEQGKQYSILCRKKGTLEAAEQITLDVNQLAEGQKFMAIGAYTVSDDGRLLAYSTDNTGFRQYTLHVKDLETGELHPERILKVTGVAWAADNKTLFYTVEEESTKRPYRVYRHTLGTDPAGDALVYEEKDPMFGLEVVRSRSNEYLFLYSGSHTTSEASYLKATEPAGEWELIAAREKDHEYYVDHHSDTFYIRTNDKGRNFRLVAAPVSGPARANWREVIAHRADVMLSGASFFRNHYVLTEREGGLPRLRVVDLKSGAARNIEFPEPTYAASSGPNPEFDTKTFRYHYQSFVTPSSVFDYDVEKQTSTLMKETEVLGGYDRTQYQSERLFATAQDGTKIPISLVYRKGLKRDGKAPALLYGYGAYGIPVFATFNSNRVSLLDRGMVFAVAHIRGGGEMGKAWHDQGRMRNKMNTFTDFIAAAEFLVAEKFTTPERLVIQGGSAGGLLMGAVVNLRPDLFRAVISQVPFVDIINTMSDASLPLTAGEWEEWGNPAANKDEYEYIKGYCPYTNLARKSYPAMLVKTAFHDSQVMYWEPAKYVAKLRTLNQSARPVLFKTNMAAGHGGASGRYDYLREIAFDYAFLLWQVGLAEEKNAQ